MNKNEKMDNYSKQRGLNNTWGGGTKLEVRKFLMSNFLTSLCDYSQMMHAVP